MAATCRLLARYYRAMLTRYADKPLIPFAIIDDQSGLYNDGYVVLACFDRPRQASRSVAGEASDEGTLVRQYFYVNQRPVADGPLYAGRYFRHG